MKIAAVTDIGRLRKVNEDSYFIYRNENLLGGMVADGMGGHRAGEFASLLVTDTVKNRIINDFHPEMDYVEVGEMIRCAFIEANTQVYERAQKEADLKGMGTTATLAMIYRDRLITVHVGDSRGYLIGEDGIRQITKDHSLVQELLTRGEISREAAAIHPNKNWITRAVGAEPDLKVDVGIRKYEGDCVLLCSDGLTNVVSDEQIAEIVSAEEDLKIATEKLIALANKKGGPDNITAVLFRK